MWIMSILDYDHPARLDFDHLRSFFCRCAVAIHAVNASEKAGDARIRLLDASLTIETSPGNMQRWSGCTAIQIRGTELAAPHSVRLV